MSDIFISYSNSDRKIAQIIVEALEHRGFSVWWDRKDILPGNNFAEVIQKSILDAKCIIVLWSKNPLRQGG